MGCLAPWQEPPLRERGAPLPAALAALQSSVLGVYLHKTADSSPHRKLWQITRVVCLGCRTTPKQASSPLQWHG